MLPSVANAVMAELVQGPNEGLAAGCFRPTLGVSDHDLTVEERLTGSMLAWQPAPLPLSTISTRGTRIGQEAACLLCDDAPPQVLDLGFELIGGATA